MTSVVTTVSKYGHQINYLEEVNDGQTPLKLRSIYPSLGRHAHKQYKNIRFKQRRRKKNVGYESCVISLFSVISRGVGECGSLQRA